MYGAPKKIDSIDKYRYLSFVKNTRNNKRVQLSCLPPTYAAAYQHLCCAYYQVQVWLGQFCSNVESNTTDEDSYEINEEISDPSFFLEQSIEMQQQGEEEESEQERITVEEFEDYLDDS
ncbi:hypothetical protein AVEN_152696-1 [Araneus ventricosus]|uniref:Uncharacterized protein n=1 Tax=Araneus ventricosus TaxID=182803 RepID=A0A4Y2SQC4_ARAVE|nr:hypothetical protein AVEN_105164-1 [Araneus ventricosus]GBN90433.1 hypothetical protein AVEN_152696-1 [Araneus ventricosus]